MKARVLESRRPVPVTSMLAREDSRNVRSLPALYTLLGGIPNENVPSLQQYKEAPLKTGRPPGLKPLDRLVTGHPFAGSRFAESHLPVPQVSVPAEQTLSPSPPRHHEPRAVYSCGFKNLLTAVNSHCAIFRPIN